MNAYQAMMAAADHIETYPRSLDFMQGAVINGDTCGVVSMCPLAHIGSMMNRLQGTNLRSYTDTALALGYPGPREFYMEMTRLENPEAREFADAKWLRDAEVCATGLRTIAQRFRDANLPKPQPHSIEKLLTCLAMEIAG